MLAAASWRGLHAAEMKARGKRNAARSLGGSMSSGACRLRPDRASSGALCALPASAIPACAMRRIARSAAAAGGISVARIKHAGGGGTSMRIVEER